jgi:hypothetical protein
VKTPRSNTSNGVYEQGRPGALQNHLPFLREGRSQVATVRAARQQIEISEASGPGRKRRQHTAKDAHALKEATTTRGVEDLFGDSHDINLLASEVRAISLRISL